ncbi:unnamed protein product [Ilex paraguariensis]|uniref:Uncharacterized protein n=1 Tax=Ilex paraguariensis TaxID=185542 RepID=A0ABC8TX46_9AQUA
MPLPSPSPMGVVEMGFEGDKGKGLLPWMPFSPFVAQVEIKEEKKNDVHEDDNVWERDSFIENFDDSDDFYDENGSKNEVTLENFNAKKINEGYPHGGEELGLKVEASEDNEHFDSWFGAGMGIGNGGNDFVTG